jgi:tetratricopeptide (TPR) repeat protein
MSAIFLCYRRDDAAGYVHALRDRLVARFGHEQIFMDIDSIEPGLDFVEVIQSSVASCDILIALIGKRWLQSERLRDSRDFVRLEIQTALEKHVRVIPVLLDGAEMPKAEALPTELEPLSRRQAFEISNRRFSDDIAELADLVQRILRDREPKKAPAQQESAAGQAKAAIERGNALLNEGKHAEARAAYQEGMAKLENKTFHPAILRAIADTYYREKKIDQAVEALKQALAIAPDNVDSLRLITTILVAENREAEAQAYMAKLPQGTTLDPNTILNLGIKAFNEGKMDQALAQFDRAVKENPNLADPYYYRALVYLNQGKNAEAKADLQKLLELDPKSKYADDAKAFLKDLK